MLVCDFVKVFSVQDSCSTRKNESRLFHAFDSGTNLFTGYNEETALDESPAFSNE